MYAADALRLEEGVSWTVTTPEGTPVVPVMSPEQVRAQNAQSMQMLKGMMAGVKGAPRV
jgi:hypothetical protein